MNTLIITEDLTNRDHVTFLIENHLLHLFPDAELMALFHQPMNLQGRLERRKIYSSAISKKYNPDHPAKLSWIYPTMVKSLVIGREIDQVIIISRGIIHGLNIPSHVKSFVYLYEWNTWKGLKFQKWLKPFELWVHRWRLKKLKSFSNICFSSASLFEILGFQDQKVVYPSFSTGDFQIKDKFFNGPFEFDVICTPSVINDKFLSLLKLFKVKNLKLKILDLNQTTNLVENYPDFEWIHHACEATLASLFYGARGVWDFSELSFPLYTLEALAMGRPVLVNDTALNKEFFSNNHGVHFISDNLEKTYEEFNHTFLGSDSRELRRFALRFNERIFKQKMKNWLSIKDQDHQ